MTSWVMLRQAPQDAGSAPVRPLTPSRRSRLRAPALPQPPGRGLGDVNLTLVSRSSSSTGPRAEGSVPGGGMGVNRLVMFLAVRRPAPDTRLKAWNKCRTAVLPSQSSHDSGHTLTIHRRVGQPHALQRRMLGPVRRNGAEGGGVATCGHALQLQRRQARSFIAEVGRQGPAEEGVARQHCERFEGSRGSRMSDTDADIVVGPLPAFGIRCQRMRGMQSAHPLSSAPRNRTLPRTPTHEATRPWAGTGRPLGWQRR
jgi:hypothetical protein